ncbi:hypothetical protein HFO33_29030 [Rhizobium leguminosarum]|uniref:hypothetical protein n=1 Tax=Rhizobium leguminosarum TaxID=384 RepID=UPI001C967FB2|nr:hypothetical protein [Rhizobium leguminosarum]MBY5720588.1 hypothetical protein [Rhizobium leguminosarum]
MTYQTDVDDIITVQAGLASFWSNAQGWAPADGAALLASARLDWTPSLARSLHRWAEPPALADGDLILAWANLGSILESSLRLFLGVYITDYQNSREDLEAINAIEQRGANQGQPYPPSSIQFEKIRQLLGRREIFPADDLAFIGLVQARRNAIHAFNNREIGNASEFRSAAATYRGFIAELATRLPYPDDVGFRWLDGATSIRINRL